MNTYLLTGITGQDGSYLAEILLDRGHKVYGVMRRSSSFNTARIEGIRKHPNLELVFGDLAGEVDGLIYDILPDAVINLASMSHVRVSFDQPVYTLDINATGVVRILEAIRRARKEIRFYQASSSEMFGMSPAPQDENTPFQPCSPYGVAKLAGYWLTKTYRDAYKMFASNGILFNHESPRRGKQFVTRKITNAAARIKLGLQDNFKLGNFNAKRDWGYAGDFVEAMYLMLQQPKPKDYVIATNETHSVREFVDETFNLVNMPLEWEGKGLNEIGKYKDKTIVKVNPDFYRPAEVDILLGDYSKAKKELGWEPKTKFKKLVKMMIESDLKLNKEAMKKC